MSAASTATYHQEKSNLGELQIKVLGMIQDYPDITSKEISSYLNASMHSVSGRLSELKEAGLIYEFGISKLAGHSYSQYRYEPDSVKQAERRAEYNKNKFVRQAQRLIDNFPDLVGQAGIAMLTACINGAK